MPASLWRTSNCSHNWSSLNVLRMSGHLSTIVLISSRVKPISSLILNRYYPIRDQYSAHGASINQSSFYLNRFFFTCPGVPFQMTREGLETAKCLTYNNNQSGISLQVTWLLFTNQQSVFRLHDYSQPIRDQYFVCSPLSPVDLKFSVGIPVWRPLPWLRTAARRGQRWRWSWSPCLRSSWRRGKPVWPSGPPASPPEGWGQK